MSFVLDASIALAWCFGDESSPAADLALGRLATEEALVPSIWPLEVANGLRTAGRRGRLDMADLPRMRDLLVALPIRVETIDLAAALGEVSDLARSLELTAYDAAYLALAAKRGLALATIDENLKRACRTAGVKLVE
ncbi:MAG TPA: type II toxin-antitoxin system VapC family toxin [Candidatus Limnocylindrales bacterium]